MPPARPRYQSSERARYNTIFRDDALARRPFMRSDSPPVPPLDLRAHGLINPGQVFANLPPAALVELALVRREGTLSDRGALVALTGNRTGRSPRDRFVVDEPQSHSQVWWGPVNRPIE